MKYGINENRRASGGFDVGVYMQSNGDLKQVYGANYKNYYIFL